MEFTNEKASFITKDKKFYHTFFGMFIVIALQNITAYSVNMADNMMLGSYSQNALSGASTVNQIFFIVQQFALSIGNSLVVLASQYWGENRIHPIRALTVITLKFSLIICGILWLICTLWDETILCLFTDDMMIIQEGVHYITIVKYAFILYIISNVLIAALRSVETVRISFFISVVSLIINVTINYILIFGCFGFKEYGIVGAAIGTIIARVIELIIILFYLLIIDKKIKIFEKYDCTTDEINLLRKDYFKVLWPIMLSQVLWGISVPMQTAILGHLSSDAIAANAVATTFYQYLKVIVIAISSTSAVMIGHAIGDGRIEHVKMQARTLSLLDILLGIILGVLLFIVRIPLLSFYNLSDYAMRLADHLMIIMSFVMVGMSYQMPVSSGIIQGGGDAKFTMNMTLISTWLIVMPLSFLSAFVWKWPVEAVVLMIQSDQFFKGIPTFIHFRKYTWMKKLTHK